FCRVEVHGQERIKGFRGPAIFVSNHASALDGVVMVQALPRKYRQRSVVVVAADSIFKRKWEAKLAQVTVNAFPIPRGGGARPAGAGGPHPGGPQGRDPRSPRSGGLRLCRGSQLLVLRVPWLYSGQVGCLATRA